MKIDISELTDAFPEFRAAVLTCTGLVIPPQRPDALAVEIARREAATRERWQGRELSEIPGVNAWRLAYKGFGIKKTSYRSSVERLVKNVLAERGLAEINGFVDAYNAVSLAHIMPVGADDLDHVTGNIAFRYAKAGDSFIDMSGGGEDGGAAVPAEDPPKDGEVVFADDAHVLCRRWNWRQDARSLISPATTRAVLTIQSNGIGDLEAAAKDAQALLTAVCGGRIDATIVDRARPVAVLPV